MLATNRITRPVKNLATIAVIIVILGGCGGPPKQAVTPVRWECTPSNLEVRSDDRTLHLKWDTNCPDSILITGYFIYLETKPINPAAYPERPPDDIEPFNQAPYPGDTDPEDSFETMEIGNLENGVEYFVSVRTVFPDGRLSPSSDEISVICRPEGRFDLAYRYADLNDGFSFREGRPVRADGEANDLYYFFSNDNVDYIASPERLNGYLRHSDFYSLGPTESIYQYPTLELDIPPLEKMPVRQGESYLVQTADGNYAKIRIEKISGERKERYLTVTYIYQTIPGLMHF